MRLQPRANHVEVVWRLHERSWVVMRQSVLIVIWIARRILALFETLRQFLRWRKVSINHFKHRTSWTKFLLSSCAQPPRCDPARHWELLSFPGLSSWVNKSFAFGALRMYLFSMQVSGSPLTCKKQFHPEGLGNKQTKKKFNVDNLRRDKRKKTAKRKICRKATNCKMRPKKKTRGRTRSWTENLLICS